MSCFFLFLSALIIATAVLAGQPLFVVCNGPFATLQNVIVRTSQPEWNPNATVNWELSGYLTGNIINGSTYHSEAYLGTLPIENITLPLCAADKELPFICPTTQGPQSWNLSLTLPPNPFGGLQLNAKMMFFNANSSQIACVHLIVTL